MRIRGGPVLLVVSVSPSAGGNYQRIMEANGLLDGCTKCAKESKEDGEFPHERCISDRGLKTKGERRLLGERAGGPVQIGCIIVTYCHYLFNCFVLNAAAVVGGEPL